MDDGDEGVDERTHRAVDSHGKEPHGGRRCRPAGITTTYNALLRNLAFRIVLVLALLLLEQWPELVSLDSATDTRNAETRAPRTGRLLGIAFLLLLTTGIAGLSIRATGHDVKAGQIAGGERED